MGGGGLDREEQICTYLVLFSPVSLAVMSIDHRLERFFFFQPFLICLVMILVLAGHRGIEWVGTLFCGVLCECWQPIEYCNHL